MEIEEVEQELHPFRKGDLPGAEQRPGQRVERAPASPARVLLQPVRPPAVLGYPVASAERALPRKGQSTTKVGLVFSSLFGGLLSAPYPVPSHYTIKTEFIGHVQKRTFKEKNRNPEKRTLKNL